jgi:2-dehydro-3-deoxygluconokinase
MASLTIRLHGTDIVFRNPIRAGHKVAVQPIAVAAPRRVVALGECMVAAVVDTTAAGDSFDAGYLAARLAGRTRREAMASASAAVASRI